MARMLHDDILKSKGGKYVSPRTPGGRAVEPSSLTGGPDVTIPSYDATGLRQVPISQTPDYGGPVRDTPHLNPTPPAYVQEHSSTDPKPAVAVGEGGYRDPAQTQRVPISGRSQRIEPPLDRPLNQPEGPPHTYGYDNLGSTAAPPRYIDSDPYAMESTDQGSFAPLSPRTDPPSHRDVARAVNDLRSGIRGPNSMPTDPSRLASLRGQLLPTSPWPHAPRLMEAGAPGTGIFSGFISASTTGEFNPDLFGWDAMRVYEQMRRTDADVAAGLLAIMLPLLSVTPEIIPADSNGGYTGNGNLAKEMAEFVRDNLFAGLERRNPAYPNTWVTQSFQEGIENALLMIPFGCAAHENLYRIDGNRIVLRFLAPRVPWTFYRWWTAEDGETLTGLEQLGYRRERYVSTTIPSRQVCVFVNRKEGSNFFGIAAIRPAYSHWYIKNQFYRIDAIAMERNGMGIPWIKFPPGAKTEDISKAQAWVEQMATSERTGLTLPDGYEFEIAGLRGRVRDPINSIKHHSQEIVRSIMAMFIALGTTETGSRALANTLLDFFRQSLQHYANIICSCYNNYTIRPLIDYNYRPTNGQPLPYPRLSFPSINVIDPIETASVIKDLANSQVGVLGSSEVLEKAVLQKFGLPYGPARTKYAPTTTMVRIMAQPSQPEEERQAGLEIEGQHPMPDEGTNAVAVNQDGSTNQVISGGRKDEIGIQGTGHDIHDTINEIIHGEHGEAAEKRKKKHSGYVGRVAASEVDFRGIPVHVENEIGSVRSGTNEDGTPWETRMKRPYGSIRGSIGLDQEEIDCFLGPYRKARNVYIIRTRHPQHGHPDEEKVMLGFRGSTEAKNTFLKHYDDPAFFGSIRSLSLPDFKKWLASMQGRKTMSDHHHQPEIGIDFDGTLATHVTPFDPDKTGDVIPEGIKKVKLLQKAGYKVWIFTARSNLQPVVEWTIKHELPLPVTNRKRPQFTAYIDDKAINAAVSPENTMKAVKHIEEEPA